MSEQTLLNGWGRTAPTPAVLTPVQDDAEVRAVVQPGGSIRDEEVVAAAQAAGVTMYFTGARHFFH